MGGHNFTHTRFVVSIFFSIFLLHVPVHAQDDACANVDCVRGTCVPSSGSVLGYDCDCFTGWKKLQIGIWTSPNCIVPDCTLNLLCGKGAPLPPLPQFNTSSPCNLVWCGDGSCVVNGTGHYCQCNAGSANLLNITSLACFQPCSFGADCSGLGFGPVAAASPNVMLAPPPPPDVILAPSPPPNGSGKLSKSWRSWDGCSNVVLLSATILALLL